MSISVGPIVSFDPVGIVVEIRKESVPVMNLAIAVPELNVRDILIRDRKFEQVGLIFGQLIRD